jgi:hypothetical protein
MKSWEMAGAGRKRMTCYIACFVVSSKKINVKSAEPLPGQVVQQDTNKAGP